MVTALAERADLGGLSMHAEARGRLPDLEANVHATSGHGTVDVRAHATLSDEKVAHVTLVARNIDARRLAATAPESNLGADATLDVKSHPNGDVEGTYTLDILAGSANGTAVPGAHFGGAIRAAGEGERKTMSITSSGVIDEPGARASIDVDVSRANAVTTVGFGIATSAPRLEETRLGPGIGGSVELRARGTLVAA
jgi:hypothetical protein